MIYDGFKDNLRLGLRLLAAGTIPSGSTFVFTWRAWRSISQGDRIRIRGLAENDGIRLVLSEPQHSASEPPSPDWAA